MLKLETYVCNDCGAEFQAACFTEFEEKERKHKCKMPNKKVLRTAELQQQLIVERTNDQVTNAIEQYKFEKLIRRGVLVCSQ